MHVPGLLERVHVTGLDEVYLVIRVDHEAQVADFLPILYGRQQMDAVPFVIMEAIPGCGPPEGTLNGHQRDPLQ
jgi:hypothetical protein